MDRLETHENLKENNVEVKVEEVNATSLHLIEIRPMGEKICFEGKDYKVCKTDNIDQIILGNEKFIYLKNPEDFDSHIFIKLSKFNFVPTEKQIEKIEEKITREELEFFLRELNSCINEDNELVHMNNRKVALKILGWVTIVILLISALGMFAGGVYTQAARTSMESTFDKFNNFPKTFPAPFFVVFVALIFMAVYLYVDCIKNDTLREYQLKKFLFGLHKTKIYPISEKFNQEFCHTRGCSVNAAPDISYIHVNLNKNNQIKICELF